MKKILSKISIISVALVMLFAAAGCSFLEGLFKTPPQALPKLPAPEVAIDGDGVAAWDSVDYAARYIYVIDDGEENPTSALSVQLEENQSVKVKAVSGSNEYRDSDFSEAKTYIKGSIPPVTHTHTDANGDKICDGCNKSVMAELSFYALNDLHGKYMDTDSQPGVDEMTTYIKKLYADTTREEVLLSSGDMWQGTVESSTNKGQLMTDWMNELGFVSMTLGNHEYDWGAESIKNNGERADFALLAINVTYNGKPVDYCQASTVVERGGIKIGVIGAIGNCLSSISGDFTEGLNFATGYALTSLVKKEATRLRSEEGCDFIVYSIHEGYGSNLSYSNAQSLSSSQMTYYDTSLSDGYVDLVFEGHTHMYYMIRDEKGVYHLQGGGENNYISCADVSYNTVTKKYTVTPKLIYKNAYASSSIEGDPVVREIYESYFSGDNDPYTTVVGYNNADRGDTAICEKVAELYYNKGVAEWSGKHKITLGGGFLKSRSPYYVYAGNVTYANLFSVLTFDNDIVLGKIKGTYLKSQFINNKTTSGKYYHIYPKVAESSINDNEDYYIVVDSYSSTFPPNHITEVARLKGTYARDLLADFVRDGGWGSPAKSTVYFGNLSEDFKRLTGYAL